MSALRGDTGGDNLSQPVPLASMSHQAHQSLAVTAPATVPVPKGGLCARDVLKNPALARLLVLAARKVKEQAARDRL